MNGTHNPHVTFTQNGDVSYDMISLMPSSTRSTQDGSLTQGIGQMSITDVNLEQALERIQELHRENNDLRGYCEIIFICGRQYLWIIKILLVCGACFYWKHLTIYCFLIRSWGCNFVDKRNPWNPPILMNKRQSAQIFSTVAGIMSGGQGE